ncbi:uncharacterized protein F4822DRAFT_410936 [Hypoxylon trugodes]|uniref:uncharacterized protein n=1 Tax=Hypoxylon trugodes TaxID=326681 RepID=UPI00219371CA|nr:uncharacterized protein F4822DRAFT_410936 [Hypoxylon trugodes]KAI1386686.1 hypothetical protein F4822DRAFT_410936 [Hypoxylon trugodes]
MSAQTAGDNATRFEESRSKFLEYPENLVRTESFRHTLELYRRRLDRNKLFDPKFRSITCLDLYQDNNTFAPSQKLDTIKKLSEYLDEEDGTPLWRLVFLQSQSARGALGCTKEQLTLLLTYYQVMPCFLDFILTFSVRGNPVAHALFRQENYLERNSPEFSLPQLKRGGVQMQHAFNLLSVERASDPEEKDQWPLRQVALYHSLDVTNGRCFWIILKGDRLIARRIYSATKHHRHLKAAEITSPETSFIASLQVQMIAIEWCSESWADYIDYLEEMISSNSVEGKAAPVEKMTSPEEIELMHSPKSTNTWGTQSDTSPISPRRFTFSRASTDIRTVFRRFSGLDSSIIETPREANDKDIEATAGVEEETNDSDKLSYLEREFSFKKFQRLSLLSQGLEQALVAIEQNKGVLTAIQEHYNSVVNSYGFANHMNKGVCDSDIATFLTRIHNTKRDLDIHHSRLQTLSRALENDKTVFTTLLQYKSEKVSEYFAKSAKTSSDKMELMTAKMHDIAVRTEQETVSMHVITIFTLIFLPGTFIAVWAWIPRLFPHFLTLRQTLFSSGVFQWNDDGNLGSDWVIRKNALKLFFSVSLPMMAIILSAWSILYLYMRRKREQEKRRLVLPVTEGQSAEGGTDGIAHWRKVLERDKS